MLCECRLQFSLALMNILCFSIALGVKWCLHVRFDGTTFSLFPGFSACSFISIHLRHSKHLMLSTYFSDLAPERKFLLSSCFDISEERISCTFIFYCFYCRNVDNVRFSARQQCQLPFTFAISGPACTREVSQGKQGNVSGKSTWLRLNS